MPFNSATVNMLLEGTRDTLFMVIVSTFMGYVLGMPIGILLAVTDVDGISPHRVLYRIVDIIVNIMRSIPFLILLIMIIPLTRLIVGKSYGSAATIVPLTIAAAPFIGRMVESSLMEVDPGPEHRCSWASRSLSEQSSDIRLWPVRWEAADWEILRSATVTTGMSSALWLSR